MKNQIILFDGVCNLCNGFVQFIIRHDKRDVFCFGSLQSDKAQELLGKVGNIGLDLKTVVFLYNKNVYTESDAILRITRALGGGWRLFYAFIVIPKFIRDGIYRFISRHRYNIFGRRDSCMIPTPEIMKKFI